jgi:hypothetical protein
MKTIDDFKKQAKDKGIRRWVIHHCSMCQYPCGYLIGSKQEKVMYDNGCGCVMYPPSPRDWQDLADQYNNNVSKPDLKEHIKKYPKFKEVLREYKEFWGF